MASPERAQGGRVYFYFAGLGGVRRQVEYLVSYDADAHALDKTGIALPTLLQALSQTPARDVIAIVDAGYSGAGGRSVAVGEGKPPGQISDPEVPPRVALIAAVSSAEIAGTVDGAGGLFTQYLLDGLGAGRADIDGDGRVTLQGSWRGSDRGLPDRQNEIDTSRPRRCTSVRAPEPWDRSCLRPVCRFRDRSVARPRLPGALFVQRPATR